MSERHCYCPDSGPQPEYLRKRGIPEGFCGICERCGKLGHMRHFPGPVPYTGAWCDACYKFVGNRYVILTLSMWAVILLIIGAIVYGIFIK